MSSPRFLDLDRRAQLGRLLAASVPTVLAVVALGYLGGTLRAPGHGDAAAWLGMALAAAAIAAAITVVADRLVLQPARSLAAEAVGLRDQAALCDVLVRDLADRTEQQRRMRHDLRGAMSPVLLVADRLIAHADPAVKRSGDIMVRTVERALTLLEPPGPASAAPSPPAGS